MDQPGSSQHPPTSSTTTNPVVAVGRKVKSVLSTHQRPSVRILRERSSTGEPSPRAELAEHHAAHEEVSRAPSKGNSFANRFADARNRAGAAIRSTFGKEENSTDDVSFEHEYDSDTVDLLDVVGMYNQPSLGASRLTLCRPRSIYACYTHQCPKLTLRPFAWETSQSSAYVSNFGQPRRGTDN